MTDSVTGEDRRGNLQLRTIFVEAYEVLLPFFDPANSWDGQVHEHLAHCALHEKFPDMSPRDVFILVTAARRVFGTTGKPAR
jgi:hypothetical protein